MFLKQIVTGRVRRWERKPAYCGHLRVYRWIPAEGRQTKIVGVDPRDEDADDPSGFLENVPVEQHLT